MKTRRSPAALAFAALLFATLCIAAPALAQGDAPAPQGIYRGLLPVVKFDISPPLRDLPPLLPLAPPKELRKQVTSPGGTTEAALDVLQAADGMAPVLRRAVAAAVKRSRDLGRGVGG